MSLRGFFSRKSDSHRRRNRASALSAHAEFLEDRVLLSVESPLLINHGVSFNNQNVQGRTEITFFPDNNPLYSNNNGMTPGRGNGDGLRVDLDGSTPDGNLVSQLRSITYSNLIFDNNSNVGSSLNLSNMVLDTLVIDSSQFTNNGRDGFIINLTNVQIGSIIVKNCTIQNNANDGICIVGTNSNVSNIQVTGSTISSNRQNDGVAVHFTNSRLGMVDVANNLKSTATETTAFTFY